MNAIRKAIGLAVSGTLLVLAAMPLIEHDRSLADASFGYGSEIRGEAPNGWGAEVRGEAPAGFGSEIRG